MFRKIVIAFIAVSVTVSMASCGNKNETEEENNSQESNVVSEVVTEAEEDAEENAQDHTDQAEDSITEDTERENDINFLEMMDGHWVRSEWYELNSENDTTEFLVESEKGSWTPYIDGEAGQSLQCTADIDGLHLVTADGNTVSYFYDGIALLTEDGTVAFLRAE